VIAAGDVVPRRDVNPEVFVVVLSNTIHIAANTGRVIACPFIPGQIPDGAMALVVPTAQPQGVAVPELVQWLPTAALDESIGNVGSHARQELTALVNALIG
jgi:mRNA-degrading endonuclease toxin of MazEF toxin-antitoxin module